MSGSRQPDDLDTGFDPTAELYPDPRARPAGVEPVDFFSLTPLQRVLLVTDGTVTTFLEAWTLEPVSVTRLRQSARVLDSGDAVLSAAAGTVVLDRAVLLVGARSGSVLAWAESCIVPDRLPAAIRREVEEGDAGLGQVLLRGGAETRREGLWYGRERRAAPAELRLPADGDFLSRCYRVASAGLPWMVITERFPWRPVRVGAGGP